MQANIITKLKEAGLTGKGGADFPVYLKWQSAKKTKGNKKFVICNASEGEPGVSKDKYILENYPKDVIDGIKTAIEFLGKNTYGYIYANHELYKELKHTLLRNIVKSKIVLFEKQGGYLAGEETTLLNVIEGFRIEPRIKPPFPTEQGLFGCPTIINNVETFYWVSKIAKNDYHFKRFYCISGEVKNKGIFELPISDSIENILKQTNNYPNFDFFIQAGGEMSGEILLQNELSKPLKGAGSIIIYNKLKTNRIELLKKWTEFFLKSNCDQCVPCREGIFRINEMLEKNKLNKEALKDILLVLEKTVLCPLGKMASRVFKSAIDKLF